MSKDDYGCTASTSQQIIKASLQRVKRKVPYMYTLEDFNQDPRDGTLASLECPRFGGIETPSADASRKLHIRPQTSESSLRSVDHVGKDSAVGGRGVRPVPKRYFTPSTGFKG